MENRAVLTPFQKKLNSLKTYVSKPSNLILIIFALVLTVTVIIPLIYLLVNTFQIHRGESFLGKVGSLTIEHCDKTRYKRHQNGIFKWFPKYTL